MQQGICANGRLGITNGTRQPGWFTRGDGSVRLRRTGRNGPAFYGLWRTAPKSCASSVATMCSISVRRLSQHNFIAEQQIHNKVSDLGLLAEMATAPVEKLETSRIEVVADRGYFRIEDIEACEAAGVTSCVRVPAAKDLRL